MDPRAETFGDFFVRKTNEKTVRFRDTIFRNLQQKPALWLF